MWPQWEYDADNQVHPYLGSAGLRGAIAIDETVPRPSGYCVQVRAIL